MVNVGDTVTVDGVTSVVTGKWAGGKYMNYELADGRVCLNLGEDSVMSVLEPDPEPVVTEDEPEESNNYKSWLRKDSEGLTDHYEE